MANILLVDDSTDIRDAVAAVLKSEHEVTWASSLTEAQGLIKDRHYDLVLLDIGLPDGDGMDFLSNMQTDLEGRGTAVIFLSGTNTVQTRTRSFSLGALDYIAKPFDIVEFQVRVNAKLKGRREVAREPVQNVLRQGPIEIRLDRQQAFDLSDNSPRQIDLTPVEFRLLLLFVQNPGDVVSRAKILDTVWGQTAHVSARCVDHHVCGLRKKISRAGSRIESVYGVGYRIEL